VNETLKAPWRAERCRWPGTLDAWVILNSEGVAIAGPVAGEAVARAMAAAPELLAACKEVLRDLELYQKAGGPMSALMAEGLAASAAQLRAAIAKTQPP
jgi:hypothetical protein